MAGHSKWSNIKHKKARQDAVRGKVSTKCVKAITVAAKTGGADPDANATLRLAIEKAKQNNLGKEVIQRAIAKASSDSKDSNYEAIRYEGYGPHSVAIIIDTLTDNKNRTVGEIRHALSKFGGQLGTSGSVAYAFKHVAYLYYEQISDMDAFFDTALNQDAIDVEIDENNAIVIATIASYETIVNTLKDSGWTHCHMTFLWVSDHPIDLDDSQTETIDKLIDFLEQLDDVQEVYSNMADSDTPS